MKKINFENLLEKDFHIVEKRKVIFIVPAVIVVIAAILMIIFNFTLGSALNLGTDFTGGYSIDVKLGSKLTDSNYDSYCNQVRDLMDSITTEEGNTYNVRIDNMQRQGSGDSSSIHVKYFTVKGASESEMIDQINPAIRKKLEENVLMVIPTAEIANNKITVTYPDVLGEQSFEKRKSDFISAVSAINEAGAGLSFEGDVADNISLGDDGKNVVITCKTVTSTDAVKRSIVNAMRIEDIYSGSVTQGDLVGATVSTELIFNAVLAVALALVFMLCYIGIRFQLSSGLACIIALFHDILVMFAFMAICHIEINSTFIAALITILGYSINNSIIVFDRVRENMKSLFCANMTSEQIANKSIRETLLRSINTTITTLIMIAMVAILGVPDIRIFAFPIIIGLISGTFSSICIAPSLWALFQRVGKKNKSDNGDKKAKQTETAQNKTAKAEI